MSGPEALAAFKEADALVKQHRFSDARAMKDRLLKSDWTIIEKRIREAEGKLS